MPITKARDIGELASPQPPRSAAEGLRAALDLTHVCYRIRPWPVKHGVQRLRAMADETMPPRDRESTD